MPLRRRILLFAFTTVLFGASAFARPAAAYPWINRHGYTSCQQCHADPSGGGLLTAYGRAQGEIILRTPIGTRSEEWEPGRSAEFAFGAVPLPASLLMGVSSRSAHLVVEAEGTRVEQFIQMQADLRAQITLKNVRAYGSFAFAEEDGGRRAAITNTQEQNVGRHVVNVLSREHWIGVDLADGNVLVRAGRMAIPFGIRGIEHTFYTRRYTRTDVNDAQQHGVAVSFNTASVRGEVMAIAGNYQVKPDDFRERGYAGYVEWAVSTNAGVGASSMVAHSKIDIQRRVELTRQAHGVFARLNPWHPVVLLGEADVLIEQTDQDRFSGYVALLQADFEPIQGVHLWLTGEQIEQDFSDDKPSHGGWISVGWFFAPHADFRIDYVQRSIPAGPRRVSVTTILYQLHFYL